MERKPSSGFTLVELLVVIGIIALLAAFLIPSVTQHKNATNIVTDQANLRTLHAQIFQMREKGKMPKEGGCKLVLAPWYLGEIEKTEPNFKRYFTPGLSVDDARYQELAALDPRTLWPDARSVTSEDTHYAGRAREHFARMDSGHEAWLANDNEHGMAFGDGTINVLYGDGSVRQLDAVRDLARYGFRVADGQGFVVGKGSPHADLAKLER